MQRIFKKVQSPEGVNPDQTATVKLAIGTAFHDLMLETNMTLANMKEIRVIANNKTIHRYSATERDMKNRFYGEKAAVKVNGKLRLKIPFDRLNMNTRAMEEVTAIHTGVPYQSGEVIRSFYVEIDIAADAVNPTLDVYATTSASIEGAIARIKHEVKHTRSSAGSGELELADLPFNAKTAQAIQSVFFVPTHPDTKAPVAITKGTVERDLYKVYERPTDMNEFIQENGERVPQANVWAIDWTENGYGGNALALNGFSDYRYRLEMADAAQITVLSEYLGILGE